MGHSEYGWIVNQQANDAITYQPGVCGGSVTNINRHCEQSKQGDGFNRKKHNAE
jgi:hypothetical protein